MLQLKSSLGMVF